MSVRLMRIDDRLIHGQIVTAWIKESGASGILVADDKAAKDPTQQMLLKLTTPKGIALYIDDLQTAATKLKNSEYKEDLLLLVRNPKSADALFDLGFHLDKVNVGNISNSKSETGRTTLLPYIHVEKQDVDSLMSIANKGIALDLRAVPSDKSIDMVEFLSKKLEK